MRPCFPRNFFRKFDALKFIPGPFWNRSRGIIAIGLTEYFWQSKYGFANPADIKFPLKVWPARLPEKALRLAEQQVG